MSTSSEGEEDTSCDKLPRDHVCSFCAKSFTKLAKLTRHVRVHTGERPYTCTHPECGKSFARNDQLKRHAQSHTNTRPHSCDQCSKTFLTAYHLRRHAKLHESNLPYACKHGCGQSFAKHSQCYEHEARTHENNPTPFLCEVAGCGRAFVSEVRLKVHSRVHDEDRLRHKCDQCGEEFNRVSELRKHKRTHATTGAYSCPRCGTTVDSVVGLEQHMTAVHPNNNDDDSAESSPLRDAPFSEVPPVGGEVFACSHGGCGKVFATMRAMRAHAQTAHFGRRFKCDACCKEFRYKQSLDQHTERVHAQDAAKPTKLEVLHESAKGHLLPCVACGAKFLHASSLKRHWRKKHPEDKLPNTPKSELLSPATVGDHTQDSGVTLREVLTGYSGDV